MWSHLPSRPDPTPPVAGVFAALYACLLGSDSIAFVPDELDFIAFGGMAERLIAPVLKTGGPQGLGGSNPSPSANHKVAHNRFGVLRVRGIFR
jgi:hypothetical protein